VLDRAHAQGDGLAMDVISRGLKSRADANWTKRKTIGFIYSFRSPCLLHGQNS